MKQLPSGRPLKSVSSPCKLDNSRTSRFLSARATKFATAVIAASLLALAPATVAQRGGGGGGGGSHGGGSSGGGGHSAGAGGSSHGPSGGSRVSSGGSSRSGSSGSSANVGKAGTSVRSGGFGAAVRHFFGLSSATKSQVQAGIPTARNEMFSGGKLPPSLQRVQLPSTLAAFDSVKAVIRPQIAAPPRPIVPHPRRSPYYPPYGYGYGCYGCDFGLGFGFGFGFEFGLFDFGYADWNPLAWRQGSVAVTDMILYFQDGSALEVSDYWVDGDTLHYVTDDLKEAAIAVKDLDLQRTIDSNERLGLKFRLDRAQGGVPLDRIQK